MSAEKRSYQMKRRADAQERTRQRIAASTAELHGTVGPARTSISAVAERAGVRRSTVYRHFPDEAALFEACSAHWREANPAPDPRPLAGIADPGERLHAALVALYGYYRRTADMYANLLRDEALIPVLHRQLEGYRGYLAAVAEVLMAGRRARGRARRRVAAAIGHALAFATWRSLALDHGLDDEDAARLMAGLVGAAAGAQESAARP
jgi:AcrR family transcriptional regulator